jgi:hypothetical protein
MFRQRKEEKNLKLFYGIFSQIFQLPCFPFCVYVNKDRIEKVAINEIYEGGQIMMTLTKERKKSILLKYSLFFSSIQIDNQRNEPTTALNGDDVDDCKAHVTFIADAIRKSRNFIKSSSDNNNNYNKSESGELLDYFQSADQNNNDSDVKKNFSDSSSYRNSSSKLRNHQMQQLLQQHVFTPHQVSF